MFKDRTEAGQKLATMLLRYAGDLPVVLALPRGGVPIGFEIARALHCPLDVVLVRKLGAPGQPELACGAVVGGAVTEMILNEDVVRGFGIDEAFIARERARALAEIDRRRALYSAEWPPVEIAGRTAILVDDGIATGASMRAAVKAVRLQSPRRLVVAAPVAPPDTVAILKNEADAVVIVRTTPDMGSIGAYYRDFHQLDDEEVTSFLESVRLPSA
jgi:putative phosphoribosyl transferase